MNPKALVSKRLSTSIQSIIVPNTQLQRIGADGYVDSRDNIT